MLEEFFAIGNYPGLPYGDQQTFKEKSGNLLKTYLLVFLSILIIAPVLVLTDHFVTHFLHLTSIQKQNTTTFQHMIQKTGYVRAVIYICLAGPILEECIFRLPLSFKKKHIAIGFALAIILFSTSIPVVKHLVTGLRPEFVLLIRLGLAALVFLLIYSLLPAELSFSPNQKKLWIIISIILFGLMHISNYIPLQWPLIWIYPVYVLPQLGMGWAMSYIRFKNGFIWGIALHCVINSVSMAISSQYRSVNFKKAPLHITRSPKSVDSNKIPAKELR